MPVPNCPHCDASIKRTSLVNASFARPYVCAECAQASRVVKPFGLDLLVAFPALVFLSVLIAFFSEVIAEDDILVFLAVCPAFWLIDLLAVSRYRLSKFLPRSVRQS